LDEEERRSGYKMEACRSILLMGSYWPRNPKTNNMRLPPNFLIEQTGELVKHHSHGDGTPFPRID